MGWSGRVRIGSALGALKEKAELPPAGVGDRPAQLQSGHKPPWLLIGLPLRATAPVTVRDVSV